MAAAGTEDSWSPLEQMEQIKVSSWNPPPLFSLLLFSAEGWRPSQLGEVWVHSLLRPGVYLTECDFSPPSSQLVSGRAGTGTQGLSGPSTRVLLYMWYPGRSLLPRSARQHVRSRGGLWGSPAGMSHRRLGKQWGQPHGCVVTARLILPTAAGMRGQTDEGLFVFLGSPCLKS